MIFIYLFIFWVKIFFLVSKNKTDRQKNVLMCCEGFESLVNTRVFTVHIFKMRCVLSFFSYFLFCIRF